jgi:hypothetical protein
MNVQVSMESEWSHLHGCKGVHGNDAIHNSFKCLILLIVKVSKLGILTEFTHVAA